MLATYALTGFANFASIGIQLGGIGGMAPTRRGDLARLGCRALLAGFLATLINACDRLDAALIPVRMRSGGVSQDRENGDREVFPATPVISNGS